MNAPVGVRRVFQPAADRLARLARLHAAAFAPHGRGWTAAEIASLAENGPLIAADDDSGFALLSLAADEAELLAIAVAPSRQRAGLGAALLDSALLEAATCGAAIMHLEVAADNAGAMALYLGRGFTKSGDRPRYYARAGGRRIDALLLARAL
ncbi:GNAT family N-acetyltransferase [Pikeienuella sp. HZG-20]|uniref:GNAT family N-acetyltransferase n=1 Tax=Paludibacillus litoralis TaxID=3133267 RepID=UPI0030ECC09F